MRRTVFLALLLGTMIAVPAPAAVVFQDLGTGIPPATLGTFSMLQMDQPALLAVPVVNVGDQIPGCPVPGSFTANQTLGTGVTPETWTTWSHGYAGAVLGTASGSGLTLNLPPNVKAFYLYIEQNAFAIKNFTVVTDGGTSSGSLPIVGFFGARGYGFYSTAGENILSVAITGNDSFKFGEMGFGVSTGCVAAPPGLVAWFPGDGHAGDLVEGLLGTPQGATVQAYPAGKVGRSFNFNGTDQYVEVPDAPSLDIGTGDFTVDAWIRATVTGGYQSIADKRPATVLTPGWQLFLDPSGNLGLQMADGVTTTTWTVAPSVADGAWHHVAVTVTRASATGGQFWLDGAPFGAPFNPSGVPGSLTNAEVLRIGQVTTNAIVPNELFTGDIDELEIFNVALAGPDLAAIFAADAFGKCKTADLEVSKVLSLDPACGGQPATYTVTLTNNGPYAAGNANLVDILPRYSGSSEVFPVGLVVAPPGWACTTGYFTVRCSAPVFETGVPAVFEITGTDISPTGSLKNDLYAYSSNDHSDATNRYFSLTTASVPVSMFDPPQDPVTSANPNTRCAGSYVTFSVPDQGVGATYVWTVTNDFTPPGSTAPVLASGQGTPSIVVATHSLSGGYFTVQLTVTTLGGCTSTYSKQYVTVALPGGTLTGPSSLCVGATGSASVTGAPAGVSYVWSVTGFSGFVELLPPLGGATVQFRATTPGALTLECAIVSSTTQCVTTVTKAMTVLAAPAVPVVTAPATATTGTTGLSASVPANAGSTYAWTITGGTITAGAGTAAITFTAGAPGTLVLTVTETNASGCASQATASVTVAGVDGPCVPDGTTLCLNETRFRVTVAWRDNASGDSGSGQAIPFAPEPPDSGWFWFFEPTNLELMVKVLDGRGVNGKFWVMYGALSDVEYTVTITDTVTGDVKEYSNAQGTMASVADIEAFSDPTPRPMTTLGEVAAERLARGESVSFSGLLMKAAPAEASPARPAASKQALVVGCVPDETTLCLNDGRFQVRVDWDVVWPLGTYGPGRALPLTTDTGCFWFFNARNIELGIKVLDGTGVNNSFWVLYGALSDVEYTITVTDTATGRTKVYENAQGVLASKADITAFPAD